MFASFIVVVLVVTFASFVKVLRQAQQANDEIIKGNKAAKEAIRTSKMIIEGAI